MPPSRTQWPAMAHSESKWEYSERAIQLVSTYKRKFKRVFTALLAKPDAARLDQKDVAPKSEDFDVLCRWLQQLSIY